MTSPHRSQSRRRGPRAPVLFAATWFTLGGFLPASRAGVAPEPAPGQTPAPETAPADAADRIRSLELEDLLVNSVSRKQEKLFQAPAAVTVLSAEEIRRSGARSIPEALRLSTGLEVARVNASQWAITTRGFNDRFANKFLVLVDGREVYNHLFGGVYWDAQDPLLEDLEQIEVIRGPGGTLWGANAVNGVVNILTKDASETQGIFTSAGAGPLESSLAARYGFPAGPGHLRISLQYHDYENLPQDGGGTARDNWDILSGGFRYDQDAGSDHLTLQGDVSYGHTSSLFLDPVRNPPSNRLRPWDNINKGANLLARWKHELNNGGDTELQAYWDYWDRSSDVLDVRAHTFNIDWQHRFPLGERQELVYGLGYRLVSDLAQNDDPAFLYEPRRRDLQRFSAFVQDEVTLIEDELKWILGSKFEHNDYTEFEYQPSTRLLWTPSDRQTLWGAVSRAIRTPTRSHNDLIANLATPNGFVFPRFVANEGVDSEDLLSFEVGYRQRVTDRFTVDLAAYYSLYDDLDSSALGTPFPEGNPPVLVLPATTTSEGSADAYGVELSADWEATDWWRLRGGYTYFGFANQDDVAYDLAATPRHQAFLRSSTDLPWNLEFDAWLRYRSDIDLYGLGDFVDLDLRLAWRDPEDRFEIALTGQNLLHSERRDFGIPPLNIAAPLSELERSFFVQVSCRF